MKAYERKEAAIAEAVADRAAEIKKADVKSHFIYASLAECAASCFRHGKISEAEEVLNALAFAMQEARNELENRPLVVPNYEEY